MYLKRYHDVEISHVGGLADPQAPRHEPPAGLAALQAPRQALEALREAAARPPGPDRREVHRAPSRARARSVLPVHRHRRLHQAPGAAHLSAATTRRRRSSSSTTSSRSCPSRSRSSRRTTASEFQFVVPLARARSGHRPRLHQARPPRGSTARWRDPTGSTTRSSTGSSTGSSSTTPSSSTTSSRSGRTSTTTHRPHGGLGGQTPYERLRAKDHRPGVNGHRQLHKVRPRDSNPKPAD